MKWLNATTSGRVSIKKAPVFAVLFMGLGGWVCSQGLWIERAKAAGVNTLGAYYRLRPVISNYHAALMEAGTIVVSAR
ncbi:MAG: hypothetical protein ACJAUG_002630 [Halioglobus sp.]|jgi:hypothetical protein